MKRDASRKLIETVSADDRFALAGLKTNYLLDDILGQMRTVSNNNIWLRSDQMVGQVYTSFAANAFNNFRLGLGHYEIVRACRFWENLDCDGYSLLTIAALGSGAEVRQRVRQSAESQYEAGSLQSRDYGERAIRSLDKANWIVRRFSGCVRYKRLLTERHKIAHALKETRTENKEGIRAKKPEFREAACATRLAMRAIDYYHRALNGSGFDFEGAERMYDVNTAFLWGSTKLNISG